ncbi:MAG: hypothetical protein V4732_17280 [Pseudomonadota bacterium]
MRKPPRRLDDANVIEWIALQKSNTETGKTTMHHDGKFIGKPKAFAICQYEEDPANFLVFYCNEEWQVLAAAGYESIQLAKNQVEKGFSNTLSNWLPYV